MEPVKKEWLRVGSEIRRRREALGLSLDRLSQHVSLSAGMISAIERGVRGCKRAYAKELDAALSSGDHIERLVEKANRPGTPLWLVQVEHLVYQAEEVRQFHLGIIPGLLQTEAYARAALRAGDATATDSQIEASVHTRMKRKTTVWDDVPPRALFVIDEAVLLRTVGGPDVMGEQLDHVLSMSVNPHVTVQILPLASAPHPGLDGSFQLLRLPSQETVLVMETRVSADADHDEGDVRQYGQDFEDLRALALAPVPSAELIRKVRETL
ncbi:helix-turn-helix transcriptional regulator [Streptomonospora sediminis]